VAEPFAVQAAARCPGLADLVLAVGAEFREVDREGALATLDWLAGALAEVRAAPPRAQCDAVAALLGDVVELGEDSPASLMLDCVLDRGQGHPALLAVVWAEVAQRAGIPIVPVGGPGLLLVAHAYASPPFLLDPARPGVLVRPDQVPVSLRRRCSHEVAFTILDELMDVYALDDDVRRATRAAELRLALPVGGRALDWVRREADALRARLAETG
jgi:regulator of sirC expression with transglutaminase-like and TPR domain